MTKCKIIWVPSMLFSDLEHEINKFISDKEVISVSFAEVGCFPNALITYKED